MRWTRYFTTEGQDPFKGIVLRQLEDEAGDIYIVPAGWTDSALETLVTRVFYPGLLPAQTVKAAQEGVPVWLQPSKAEGAAQKEGERDIRDAIRRVAGAATWNAWRNGFFDSESDARIFYDELCHALLHRIVSFETGYWRAIGIDWAYGLVPPPVSLHHSIYNFDAKAPRALRRARLLGENLALDTGHARAMISLPIEHPDSAAFISWKREAEARRVGEELGLKTLSFFLHSVMEACDRGSFSGFNPRRNKRLADAMETARAAGVPEAAILSAVRYAEQGFEAMPVPGAQEESFGEDLICTAVSLSDAFIEAGLTGHGFALLDDQGEVLRHAPAQKIWDALAEAIWATGAPFVHFRAQFQNGYAADESGAFIYKPGTIAPAGAINLLTCAPAHVPQAARLLTVALDIAAIDEGRPIMVGFSNAAAMLMREGIAYDSEAGRAMMAHLAGLMRGASLEASAEMAAVGGAYDGWRAAEKEYLAALKEKPGMEAALSLGRKHGFRHAHLCGLTLEEGLHSLLGVITPGLMPEATLMHLGGQAAEKPVYARAIHPSVPLALAKLGYKPREVEDIHFYVAGHGTLLDAPHINHASLRARGLNDEDLARLERALRSARHLRHAFLNGEILAGFSEDQIEAANLYVCGAGTLEGAPHLKSEHLAVFDCAFPPSSAAVRRVLPEARVRMQAAVEKSLCGGAGHVIALGSETSIEDIQKLIVRGWEWGAKTLRFYRDGCSWLQPALPETLDEAKPSYKQEENEICQKQSATA